MSLLMIKYTLFSFTSGLKGYSSVFLQVSPESYCPSLESVSNTWKPYTPEAVLFNAAGGN